MIEDVFLTYTNENTENNPKFFHAVYEQVKRNIPIDLTPIDKIIPIIEELLSIADPIINLNFEPQGWKFGWKLFITYG